MPGPVLFCYDGSEGSRAAIGAAADLVAHPAPAVVLTIWRPAAVLVARAGGVNDGYISEQGEGRRRPGRLRAEAAEDGVAARGRPRPRRERSRRGGDGRRRAAGCVGIADEIDAGLIVCGRRGLGTVASALLGSVSRQVLAHAGRPRC